MKRCHSLGFGVVLHDSNPEASSEVITSIREYVLGLGGEFKVIVSEWFDHVSREA